MESQQPRNRLREKCGYVYGSIRSITWERPDVYASGRTDAERGVIEGWLTWQVGHAEGRALPAAGPWGLTVTAFLHGVSRVWNPAD